MLVVHQKKTTTVFVGTKHDISLRENDSKFEPNLESINKAFPTKLKELKHNHLSV